MVLVGDENSELKCYCDWPGEGCSKWSEQLQHFMTVYKQYYYSEKGIFGKF